MYNEKSLIGKKPYLYKLNEVEGIDITSETDFEIAEFFYKKINKISEKNRYNIFLINFLKKNLIILILM